MNKVWNGLIIIGLLFALFTNNLVDVGAIILESGKNAFDIYFNIALMMLFWNGIFNIAKKAGIVRSFCKIFKKPLSKIFPEVKEDETMDYICGNIVANMLGLGSAATPLGLKAMEQLKKESNLSSEIATRSMITFVLLNIATITFFPTTIVSLRKSYFGDVPTKLIIIIMIVSIISTVITLFLDRIFYLINQKKKK